MSTANTTPHGPGMGPKTVAAAPSERDRLRSERAARSTGRQARNDITTNAASGRVHVYSGGRYSAGRHKAPARTLVLGVALSSGGGVRPRRVGTGSRLIRTLRPRVGTASVAVIDRAVSG